MQTVIELTTLQRRNLAISRCKKFVKASEHIIAFCALKLHRNINDLTINQRQGTLTCMTPLRGHKVKKGNTELHDNKRIQQATEEFEQSEQPCIKLSTKIAEGYKGAGV